MAPPTNSGAQGTKLLGQLPLQEGSNRIGPFCPLFQVKCQLEQKTKKKYPIFKAVEFKSQTVAGTNYFIKVQVDDSDFIHIRVFESLPHENRPVTLHDYQTDKSRHDELDYF
ncbi:cystatin-B [Pteropus vampyrus]|uniref:Cystatin-B n=1 Tax=Pteropus vampyrus TaxID=132908 RepID=A0A6P6BV02_PTEVA|nr:cystatin-B [Pteropus vampyrus]